jgi:hypothetical protein
MIPQPCLSSAAANLTSVRSKRLQKKRQAAVKVDTRYISSSTGTRFLRMDGFSITRVKFRIQTKCLIVFFQAANVFLLTCPQVFRRRRRKRVTVEVPFDGSVPLLGSRVVVVVAVIVVATGGVVVGTDSVT